MSSGIITSAEPTVIDLEEELADFTGDLLSAKSNEFFLKRLFSKSAGVWSSISEYPSGHENVVREASELQISCNGSLRVTWLEHPDLEQGYCLVLFYVDAIGWNSLALYNKERLDS